MRNRDKNQVKERAVPRAASFVSARAPKKAKGEGADGQAAARIEQSGGKALRKPPGGRGRNADRRC